MEHKLPCVDCIVLPICKNQVLKRQQGRYIYLLVPLVEKCSIFSQYLDLLEYENVTDSLGGKRLKNPKEIIDLFKIEKEFISVV